MPSGMGGLWDAQSSIANANLDLTRTSGREWRFQMKKRQQLTSSARCKLSDCLGDLGND